MLNVQFTVKISLCVCFDLACLGVWPVLEESPSGLQCVVLLGGSGVCRCVLGILADVGRLSISHIEYWHD